MSRTLRASGKKRVRTPQAQVPFVTEVILSRIAADVGSQDVVA